MMVEFKGQKSTSRWDHVHFKAVHPLFRYQVDSVSVAHQRLFERYQHFVVVGLGGSVLPLKALRDAASLQNQIHFVDRLDRRHLAKMLNLENALYCIVSKSGETLEIKTLLHEILQSGRTKDCLFVTDAERGFLRSLAPQLGVPTMEISSELGGRFTHFTPFHRALFERFQFDFEGWLDVAKSTAEDLKVKSQSLRDLMDHFFDESRCEPIVWAYGDRFLGLCEWIQQAIAESLGKISRAGKRVGVMPIVLKGPQDQHSVLQILMEGPQTRSLLFFGSERRQRDKKSRPIIKGFESLAGQGLESIEDLFFESIYQSFVERLGDEVTRQPVGKFELSESMEGVVRVIVLFQAFVEFAGQALEINAFDQPGVERGKQIARGLLQKGW